MTSWLSWIVILLLQTGILSTKYCDTLKHVPSAEGESVDLQVNKSAIKEISWVFNGRHIATTIPDKPIEIKSQSLKNRLDGKPGGSLTINKLSRSDQGTYAANIFPIHEKESVQCYNVTIYRKLSNDDIEIHHNTSDSEPCEVTLICSVDLPNVKISWTYFNNATTKEGSFIHVKPTHTNVTHTCTATNPVSIAARMVTPQDVCGEVSQENVHIWSLWIVPMGILSVLVAVSIILIWIRKKKPEGSGGRNNPKHLQHMNQRCSQPSEDHYSEMQCPKKPPLGRREDRMGMVCLYDEIRA